MAGTAAAAGASTRARDTYYIQIKGTNYVSLVLKNSAFADAGLRTALGLETELPSGATIVGVNKEDALRAGCVPVVLAYEKTAGSSITQSAKVLCSPATADTVFTAARNQNYSGKKIKQVRFPRRRVYII